MTKHLSTLSILHYVYGVFVCLSGLAALLVVLIGGFMRSELLFGSSDASDVPAWLGGFIQVIGLFIFFLIETWGVLSLLTGSWIAKRKHRTATMVMAGVHCLNVPFGLLLGIYTIVVMVDDEVRNAYGEWLPSVSRTEGDLA